MLKQCIKVGVALTSVLILAGCDFDESFSNDYRPAPVHSTGSQITPGNRSMGSPFRDSRVQSTGGVVTTSSPGVRTTTTTTTTRQATVVVTPDRSINTRNSNVPAPVMSQPAPVVTQPAPVVSQPAPIQSTGSSVTGTYNGD